tara:strand:- start:21804 stop:22268 length:465 start_codon:yes stop_codon:yes gene_type:complete
MVSMGDVNEAQKAWGDGIVAIASAHTSGQDYVEVAKNHVENLYAYGMTSVLFKPTLAEIEQFRPDFESALSYFVASNNACPEDKGFAIKGWTKVRFENSDVILNENSALTMGNYYFTDASGKELKVEFTFCYIQDDLGKLRIQLHHSSMPATSD